MKLLTFKIALAIASICFAIVLIEGVLRGFGFAPEKRVNPLFSWTRDQGELWLLQPGATWRTRRGNYPVRANSYGLRGPEIPHRAPGRRRILFLGDSVTFGHGQPLEATFVRKLERRLARRLPRVEVLNAGIPGWSTHQERLFYERYADDLDPDVVLVGFVLNDVTEIHRGLLEVGLKTGMRMIRVLNWLAEHSSTGALAKTAYAKSLDPRLRELRAGADLVYRSDEPAVRLAMSQTIEEFRKLAQATRAHGDRFGVVLFPFRFQLQKQHLDLPQRQIADFCSTEKIAVLDTLPHLRRYDASVVLMDHDHFTAVGHRVVADLVEKWLYQTGLLDVPR